MKKLITMLVVLTMSVSMLAACGGQDSDTAADTTTKAAEETKAATADNEKTDEAAMEEGSKFLASDERLVLSIFESLKKPFDNDYPVFLKAGEMTNIYLEGVVSQSSSDAKEAFNLMMASGDLADIVAWDRSAIQQYAVEGAFIPLEDLIAEHAPNIQAFFDARPEIKAHATASDGSIYHIPFVPDGDAAQAWFIRQDWLDKLGLEQPKNAEELYTVLKAFKEQDPNGNGEADEIPFFHRGKDLQDLALLWGARNGINNTGWYLDGDTVKYGPYEPELAVAYKELAKWYAEGLIDPEIYTRGGTARDFALKENVGGMTHDWFGSTSGYNDGKVDVEGFNFIPFAPPADMNGVVSERTVRNKLHWGGWAIAASNQHPIETIKYFDFFFTEEGRRLMNFGIEGETYDMVDGKPVLKDSVINAEQGAVFKLREYGAQTATGYQQDFEYEKQWMNPIAFKGVEMYTENGYFAEPFPTLQLTDEELQRHAELMVAIDSLVSEHRQKWVLGAEEVDASYDSFIKSLETFGVEEAISIMQAAYDRHIGK